jgi:stage II sporulation protein GA (sporulation sigma-E factor processing peptidase)
MTLYVDIVFLENVFMNSIILLATGVILKDKTRIIRNLISSSIGAVYAIIIYTSHIEIYSNIFLKIMLSLVIVYIAFKPQNTKSLLKHLIIFYLTSFTFGGVAFALLYFVRPQDILLQNGVLIGTYPIKMILIGGIVGFVIITISFKNIKGKLKREDIYCNVKLNVEEKTKIITALIDTGNFLKDPITKIPVIVAERESLKGLFPDEILLNTSKIINGGSIDLGEYASKVRVIPFKSLGKDNGLLLGIKIDEAYIEYQDNVYEIKNVIIGIYNGILSRNRKYVGLVGLDVINE